MLFLCLQVPLSGMHSAALAAGEGFSAGLSPRVPRHAVAHPSPKSSRACGGAGSAFSPVVVAKTFEGAMPDFELPPAGKAEDRRDSDASSVSLAAGGGVCGGVFYSPLSVSRRASSGVDFCADGFARSLCAECEARAAVALGTGDLIGAVVCLEDAPAEVERFIYELADAVVDALVLRIPCDEELSEDPFFVGAQCGIDSYKKIKTIKPVFADQRKTLQQFISECRAHRSALMQTIQKIKSGEAYLPDDLAELESSSKHLAYWTGFQTMFLASLYELGPRKICPLEDWRILGSNDGRGIFQPELYGKLLELASRALAHFDSEVSKAGSLLSADTRIKNMQAYWTGFKQGLRLAAIGH